MSPSFKVFCAKVYLTCPTSKEVNWAEFKSAYNAERCIYTPAFVTSSRNVCGGFFDLSVCENIHPVSCVSLNAMVKINISCCFDIIIRMGFRQLGPAVRLLLACLLKRAT